MGIPLPVPTHFRMLTLLASACALTAALGFCYEPTFRTVACPFTCGYCTCKDGGKAGDCARAKEEGKCDSDPVIKASCMATCGLCACRDRPSLSGAKTSCSTASASSTRLPTSSALLRVNSAEDARIR